MFDEDQFSADDLIGVIEPKKLTHLLGVTEEQCQSEALFMEALELPL